MENNFFQLVLTSPLQNITYEKVVSVIIETDSGQIEILPGHINFGGTISFGQFLVVLEGQEIIYKIFNGNLCFDNEKNLLQVFCLEYSYNTVSEFTFEDIVKSFKDIEISETSKFKLKFLEDSRIALEKSEE
jgi:hypothetical protein